MLGILPNSKWGWLILCTSATVCANAQTLRSTIAGVVFTDRDKPIAEATVKLLQEETGRLRQVITDTAGEFFASVPAPGTYRMEVERSGFRRDVRRITLQVNQEVRIEVPLLAGSQTDTIEVTAVRGLLKPETASMGTVIDNHQVVGLPLDGRNFLDLSLLVPGAVPAAQGSAGSARGDFALNVNGSREDGNNFLLDGVYNGDPKLNTFGVNTSVDAIQEFEVITSTYDAAFGRNGGAQVNVVLKSGTNQIHSTAYEFFRNAALDGRNFFAPAGEPDPKYQRNQFGFSLGGPIRQNRTFFFGDYEGRRVREGLTRVTNVPTALERTGDFSQSQVPFIIDAFAQAPFSNNRIPAQRLHPIGSAIASLYPLPNRNAFRQNFVSSPASRDRNDQFDARVDHELASASDISVRYSFADRDFYEPFATGSQVASIPGFGNDVPRRSHNLMVSETHAFSPALLNEFRAAFTRVASSVLQENRGNNLSARVGLPVVSANPRDTGMTFITLPGYSSLGDEGNNPQQSATNTYQILDQATWSKGRSMLKFGFDFRRLQQNAFRDVQSRGFINFFGFTGDALSDMLQGLHVASGVAQLDNPQYLRMSSYNFFVNDTWRVTSRLTLTLGARYEFNTPPVDKYDRANLVDPATMTLVPVGRNGFPRGGYEADRNNFAPRLGFAWQPTSDAKTLLRGGYGVYFDQSALAPSEGLYFSPPYFTFRLFVALPQFPLLLHDPYPANYPFSIPPSATAFQRDLRTAYMQHWNVNVQRQLGGNRILEVGYVGSKGTKLFSARDINQAAPSAAAFNPRPVPFFEDVNVMESRASSNYHSLQTRFQQRLSAGMSALVSYTWSKSIDDASGFFASTGDPNFPQDSRNVRAERARSNFDVAHRLTASYSYDLPFGQGKLLGGWQTFGIVSLQTGRPFTVSLLSELDNSGTGRSTLGFGANDRPDYLRDARLESPTSDRWFDTTAFRVPARGTFGNAGRNILDGPGSATVNFSIVKNLALSESTSMQFRVEAFNLFNRTNFNLPDIFVDSPSFGRISSAGSPRHVQLGLKFLF
jgi:hypothetical protein